MSRGRHAAPLFRNRYRIPSARLPGWDYRRPGIYFLTICTLWRDQCLGEVAGGEVTLSDYGKVVAREWQAIPGGCPRATLDAWIVMPDHLHGIVVFGAASTESEPVSLATVIGQFKKRSTKAIRARGYQAFAWQERFHDGILDSLEALERARAYIRENPQRWEAKRKKP